MSGRFFEDNPVRTLVWLAVVSVVVGFVLVTLNISPIRAFQDLIGNLDAAVEALAKLARWIGSNLGQYFLAGVVVVVPLWLIHRLVNLRKGR